MTDPIVCAVMLTRDRPEMAARAVRCFRAQTYANKRLLILDNGDEPYPHKGTVDATYYHMRQCGDSVGQLRNWANQEVRPCTRADVIIHWDDDDWSHPNRMAEQVALLQSSGAQAVGYNEMIFWDSTKPEGGGIMGAMDRGYVTEHGGMAWVYSHAMPNYCLGTSLCYWRRTWEEKPFPLLNAGEDTYWQAGLRTAAVRSVRGPYPCPECGAKRYGDGCDAEDKSDEELHEYAGIFDNSPHPGASKSHAGCAQLPRMIATIHGGNTSSRILPAIEWRRNPKWDVFCRKTLGSA